MSFDKTAFKDVQKGFLKFRDPKAVAKSAVNIDPGNVFRTGRTSARKSQERQSLLIERQRQREELRLAESESEISRRKVLAKSGRGGRRSLIKTSETGTVSTTLGGG